MTTHAPKAPAAPNAPSAPAAPAAPAAAAAAATEKAPKPTAEEKAAKKAADKAAKDAAKPPKVEREKQNGQTKPAEGTLTRKLWDIIDKISADKKEPAARKEVMEAAAAHEPAFNTAMAASLYSHWRKFHGLTGSKAPGRTAKPEDDKATGTEGSTAPAAPAAPAAPKA